MAKNNVFTAVSRDFLEENVEKGQNFRHEITAFAHQGLKWGMFCVMLQMKHKNCKSKAFFYVAEGTPKGEGICTYSGKEK